METPILPAAGSNGLHWLGRIVCALPLLLSCYYVFVTPQVSYTRRIDLRAPGLGDGPTAPGAPATVERTLAHSLIEMRDRAVILSGVSCDPALAEREDPPPAAEQKGPRLQLVVRKAGRAMSVYQQVMEPPLPDRMIVHAVLPADAPSQLSVDERWSVQVTTRSDYLKKVTRRLWALLLGGLATAVALQLIARARAGRLRS